MSETIQMPSRTEVEPPVVFESKSGKTSDDKKLKLEKAKVEYTVLNQGAPNEHLIVVHEFNKPGTYSYDITFPRYETALPVPPGDQGSLNRGVTLAAEIFSCYPIISPCSFSVKEKTQRESPPTENKDDNNMLPPTMFSRNLNAPK